MTADVQALPNRFFPVPTLHQQAIVTGLLAGWADWLFFGHGIGVGFTIFIIGLAAAIVLIKHSSFLRHRLMQASAVLFIAILPAVEEVNLLSVGFATIGTVTFVMIVHDKLRNSIIGWLENIAAFLFRIPIRLPADITKVFAARKRRASVVSERLGLSVWVLPVALVWCFWRCSRAPIHSLKNG